jgi:soluble lytic murein transglycosylase
LSPQKVSAGIAEHRAAFTQAEDYLNHGKENEYLAISQFLTDYIAYPYLRYQYQKKHLDQTAAIKDFLMQYKDTRYAELLQAKWLGFLAEKGEWLTFLQFYKVDNNNFYDCNYLYALSQTDKQDKAWQEAKRIWLSGQSTSKACKPLFSQLSKSSVLTSDDIWKRFETVLNKNKVTEAKLAFELMDKPSQAFAKHWLDLHQQPENINDAKYWHTKDAKAGHLFAHAVTRLAHVDLDSALRVWESKAKDFPIDNLIVQKVESHLGTALLFEKDNRAYDHLHKIVYADDETREARVRAALLEQNWQHVAEAISGLTSNQQQEPQWQYWQARMLAETGKKQQAQTLYKLLAKDRSFYGFIAAEATKAPFDLHEQPVKVNQQTIDKLLAENNFKLCQELKLLGKEHEARRQWAFAIKNLSREELLAAAKIAQQWQWHQTAIVTLVKADYWDDMTIRFPTLYLENVEKSASEHKLESALIYGLMRQESMLDSEAVSPVGAMGLMQIMPKTAQTIAKALNVRWTSDADLLQPETNIHFGTYYFRDLINRFGGHIAVAGAAYNAGPSRAKFWLPTVSAVPADIWIETIPFKETRKYVSRILGYAMIYQLRLNKQQFKLTELLSAVQPGKI